MKLKTGDRCPCCGQPIATKDPAKLALLAQLADSLGVDTTRTCGTCPVAIATAHDHLVVCPFAEKKNGVGLRGPDHPCTREVVE